MNLFLFILKKYMLYDRQKLGRAALKNMGSQEVLFLSQRLDIYIEIFYLLKEIQKIREEYLTLGITRIS